MMISSQRQISLERIFTPMPMAEDKSLRAELFNHGKRGWTSRETAIFILLLCEQLKSSTLWEEISRSTGTKLSQLAGSTRTSCVWPINSRRNSHFVGEMPATI